jgi:hypothetical protein
MAIAKKPNSNRTDIAKKEAFIAGKGDNAESGKVATLVRFDRELLRRIDAAAKRRGISRAGWLGFVASRALDEGDG